MQAFIDYLPEIGYCLISIFAVTAIIIGITSLLNKLTEKKN